MNNYEKIAILVLRITFFLVLVVGIHGLPYCAVMLVSSEFVVERSSTVQLMSTLLFIINGTVGLIFSRKLGKWLAREL